LDIDRFTAVFREALLAIDTPRLFDTERGYQGELLAQISRRVELPPYSIAEQEYQKQQQRHGLAIRPDIVIHEPFDERRHRGREEGNFAVIELKLRGSRKRAAADFESLASMIRVLHYPLGIFVNIGSSRTYSAIVPGDVRGRVLCFGVTLEGGKVTVHEEWT
jgi:hypothetical protein